MIITLNWTFATMPANYPGHSGLGPLQGQAVGLSEGGGPEGGGHLQAWICAMLSYYIQTARRGMGKK